MKSIRALHQELLENGLVIATQANSVPAHKADCEKIKNAARIRTAIDIVTEIDLDGTFNGPAADIVVDARDSLRQEVGAPMNIAYSVNTRAGGDDGGRS